MGRLGKYLGKPKRLSCFEAMGVITPRMWGGIFFVGIVVAFGDSGATGLVDIERW
jgi:hypothetical protein